MKIFGFLCECVMTIAVLQTTDRFKGKSARGKEREVSASPPQFSATITPLLV